MLGERRSAVILWDIDSVQAITHIPVLRKVNRYLSTDIRHHHLTRFDFVHHFALRLTGSREIADEVNKYWFDPDTLRQSPPYRAHLWTMNTAREQYQAENFSVTTRIPETRDATVDWLTEYVSWMIDEDRLRIRSDHSISGDAFKVANARDLKADLFIEDNGDTSLALLAAGFNVGVVNQPWNWSYRELDPYRLLTATALTDLVLRTAARYRQ